MLKYKVGCLIKAAKDEVFVIAHQCNCFCAMGAGIAPLIAEEFPEAERVDDDTIVGDKSKLGSFTHHYDDFYAVDIFNLYGQYAPSTSSVATDYTALRSSLKGMANWMLETNEVYETSRTIGLPKIGAGLGGGDWGIISKIIEEELAQFDVTIYVLDEKEIPNE